MIRRILHTATLILLVLNNPLHAQDCEVPEPPVLRLISVDPQSGKVSLFWNSSPSSGVSAYIVYWYDSDNNGWMAVNDTIWDPGATSFEYSTSGTKYQSMDFRVAAYRSPLIPGRPGCPSKLSNSLSTIFLSAEADTCRGRITLRWNRYSDASNPLIAQNILISLNNSSYTALISLSPEIDNYTINNFNTDSNYSFVISAALQSGNSTSYKSDVSTFMMRPPEWINADFASSEGDDIKLSFTADPLSEITRYNLERKTDNGTWTMIKDFNTAGKTVLYTDNQVEKNKKYAYRLLAINGCNNPVTISNVTKNIVVSVNKSSDNIVLMWNNPGRLASSLLRYEVFVDHGNGFSSFASTSDTVYIIRPADLFYDVVTGEVCFEIKAYETGNIHGINSIIKSSGECFELPLNVTMPNIFTPNNDLKNDLFSPVLSFTPAEYLLLITDKNGKVVFETRDYLEKWDGTIKGKPQGEGIYLWYFKLKAPSGEIITKTGTVTIIR